jgi:glucokinase-like ROK family protein
MSSPKPTIRDLRRINRSTVLRRIYFDGSMSRQELSQSSGLSPATVTNVVAELFNEGIVLEAGLEESQGGRPRTILNINPNYGYFIGVDVGETLIRIELFDLTLSKLRAAMYPLTSEENQPQVVVQRITAGVRAVLDEAGISPGKVIGLGIGVPGVVERTENVFVYAPAWKWHKVPFMTMLKERLDMPIYLDNGAKAMAQAEMWFGAGQGVENLAVLLIGTGIGAGIVAQGVLYRGATNSAGEWGHTTIELDGRLCRCGSRGCLEAYAGAPGIIKRLSELAPQSPILQSSDQMETIAAIAGAAQRGDPAANQVLKDTAHYLGAGVANIINLFNPQLIVLGGWVGLQIGEYILAELRQFVDQYALKQPLGAARIALCQLGQDAVAEGAATLALEGFFATSGRLGSRSLNVELLNHAG